MTTLQAIDFDRWRADYHLLSDDEQLALNATLAGRYPDQDHATLEPCRRFFTTVPVPVDVAEIGGWTGRVADFILDRFPGVWTWLNIETAAVARRAAVPRSNRYTAYDPGRFFWWRDEVFTADVVVACHVLEHFPAADVEEMLRAFPAARHLHVEMPLPAGGDPPNWSGYEGTHMIEVGWAVFDQMLAEQGWRQYLDEGDARSYRRAHDDDPGEGSDAR